MIQNLFRNTFRLLRSGSWKALLAYISSHWNSEGRSVGLERDLNVPFEAPTATIPITIRPLRAGDVEPLLEADGTSTSTSAASARELRRQLIDMDLATCYVAATEDDEPCFMQWLVGPEENDTLQRAFNGRLPRLQPGEMMLLGMFTPDRWHGRRIAPAAMAGITELATERGASRVLVFMLPGNVAALRASVKAGFRPYTEATHRWRRFRLHNEFTPLQDRAAGAAEGDGQSVGP